MINSTVKWIGSDNENVKNGELLKIRGFGNGQIVLVYKNRLGGFAIKSEEVFNLYVTGKDVPLHRL